MIMESPIDKIVGRSSLYSPVASNTCLMNATSVRPSSATIRGVIVRQPFGLGLERSPAAMGYLPFMPCLPTSQASGASSPQEYRTAGVPAPSGASWVAAANCLVERAHRSALGESQAAMGETADVVVDRGVRSKLGASL